jgi:hypothetical protein
LRAKRSKERLVRGSVAPAKRSNLKGIHKEKEKWLQAPDCHAPLAALRDLFMGLIF